MQFGLKEDIKITQKLKLFKLKNIKGIKMRADSKIAKIPKDKFEKVYLNNTVAKSSKILKISISGVSKLARIYDVRKNNIMR